MDRQSSGLLTDIPVAYREYEGVRNVVGGSDIAHFAEVRVARLLHCGITFGIQGTDIVFPADVRIMRSLHCVDFIWNSGFEHLVFRGGEDQEFVALRVYCLFYTSDAADYLLCV